MELVIKHTFLDVEGSEACDTITMVGVRRRRCTSQPPLRENAADDLEQVAGPLYVSGDGSQAWRRAPDFFGLLGESEVFFVILRSFRASRNELPPVEHTKELRLLCGEAQPPHGGPFSELHTTVLKEQLLLGIEEARREGEGYEVTASFFVFFVDCLSEQEAVRRAGAAGGKKPDDQVAAPPPAANVAAGGPVPPGPPGLMATYPGAMLLVQALQARRAWLLQLQALESEKAEIARRAAAEAQANPKLKVPADAQLVIVGFRNATEVVMALNLDGVRRTTGMQLHDACQKLAARQTATLTLRDGRGSVVPRTDVPLAELCWVLATSRQVFTLEWSACPTCGRCGTVRQGPSLCKFRGGTCSHEGSRKGCRLCHGSCCTG